MINSTDFNLQEGKETITIYGPNGESIKEVFKNEQNELIKVMKNKLDLEKDIGMVTIYGPNGELIKKLTKNIQDEMILLIKSN